MNKKNYRVESKYTHGGKRLIVGDNLTREEARKLMRETNANNPRDNYTDPDYVVRGPAR